MIDLKVTLLTFYNAERKKFFHEDYIPDGNIFSYTEKGEYSLFDGKNTYTVKEGDCVSYKEGVRIIRKVIKPVVLHLYRYKCDRDILPAGIVKFSDPELIGKLSRLAAECNTIHSDDEISIQQSFFSSILCSYRMENSENITGAIEDKIIKSALSELENKFCTPIKLSKIAEKNFISYVQFLRRFKKAVHMTPEQYLITLRMNKAKTLLLSTDTPVSEISGLCGFENAYYFSNAFKKTFKVSPSEYRKSIKGSI